MNTDYLRDFIELSRQLNFTTTAKTLNMTQPSLSNHIRLLESEAGVLLVERPTKTQARLTPAGQLFLDMSKKMLALYDEALPKLKELQENTEGRITIRSPRHEFSFPLLNYILEFQEGHPKIDMVIQPWIETDGIEDVTSGAVDCAYVGGGDSDDDSLFEKYGIRLVPYSHMEVLLWVDAAHPLATLEPLTVHALNGYSILVPSNKKNPSWALSLQYFFQRYNIDCQLDEKFCDSLEDLILTKTTPEDLFLCNSDLITFPPFQLKENRIIRHFTPSAASTVCLGYKNDLSNTALQLFVDYLRERYEASIASQESVS